MEDAKNISKTYDPKEFEDRIYNEWMEKGYFTPKVDKNKAFYNNDAAPEYNRTASSGACSRLHASGFNNKI